MWKHSTFLFMSWIFECYLNRINREHHILLEVEFIISKIINIKHSLAYLLKVSLWSDISTWVKQSVKKALSGPVLWLLFDLYETTTFEHKQSIRDRNHNWRGINNFIWTSEHTSKRNTPIQISHVISIATVAGFKLFTVTSSPQYF